MNKIKIWENSFYINSKHTNWGFTDGINLPGNEKRAKGFYAAWQNKEYKELNPIWENDDFDYEGSWESELNVKNKVFSHVEKHGGMLEKVHETFYINKEVLKRGLNKYELKFLNAYRDRFLLLVDDNNRHYIYDNYSKRSYEIEELETFKDFKNKLKKLNLI